MSYTGTVVDGAVKLPKGAVLPNGTKVEVQVVERPPAKNQLTDRLLKIAEKVKGLPADLAREHDHHIHGTAKRRQ
jgi:hypothetical protein